jgi:hypothetical protein
MTRQKVAAMKAMATCGGVRSVVGMVVSPSTSDCINDFMDVINKVIPIPIFGLSLAYVFCFSIKQPLHIFIQMQWCDWCANFGGNMIHICEECWHKICAALGPGMSGCIQRDTVWKNDIFQCPDCSKDGLKVSLFLFHRQI